MAKLTRKTQKIFANNANSDQITAFGTAKSSSPTYTTDVDKIQTEVFELGWRPSLVSDLAPYLQDSNGLWYAITRQLAYLYQQGIAEWDINTTYFENSLAMLGANLYKSKTDNNTGHTVTDSNYWSKIVLGGDIGQPIIRLDNTINDGEIRLEGAEVSRTTYANLFAIYGTTYGAGDGSTTFNLPDFRNRVPWGATNLGYINAGLPNITGVFDVTNNWPTRAYGDGTASPRGTGAFTVTSRWSTNVAGNGGTGAVGVDFDFNASRSSSIYGSSTTVQPPAVKVRVVTRYV